MSAVVKIGSKLIGHEQPVYLVAEIGSNHCRDRDVVRRLIEHAAEAGFDAAKFQTYEPLEVFSGSISTGDVDIENIYGSEPLWKIAESNFLMPREWFAEMFSYARDQGLEVFSTVHSEADAEFILNFSPPLFKVASLDVSYTGFLRKLARFGKPIVLSTGMHELSEIERAVGCIRDEGLEELVLLHCVSRYPPKPEEFNLRNIPMLAEQFQLPVGFSDHHPENHFAVAAVTLGACLIEKHVTLDRNLRGVDHPFALHPEGMRDLVQRVRETEISLGGFERSLSAGELETRNLARRSLVARTAIARGELFSYQNVKVTRPGTGIPPEGISRLVGRKAVRPIQPEELISWEMVEQS